MMHPVWNLTSQSANIEEIESPKASSNKRKRSEADEALEQIIGNYGGSPWIIPAKKYSSGIIR